jgi:hypothetical protein
VSLILQDVHRPSPSTSRPRVSSPNTTTVSLPTTDERSSRRSSERNDHPSNKRPRRGSRSDDMVTAPTGNSSLSSHPYPAPPRSAVGHPPSSSSFNPLFHNPSSLGGQQNNALEFLRNPASVRSAGSYPPYIQGGMHPPRYPPAVSEGFLASLSEVASQQSGVGCGIGGVGGGMNGFEWPGGYPSNPHHGGEF